MFVRLSEWLYNAKASLWRNFYEGLKQIEPEAVNSAALCVMSTVASHHISTTVVHLCPHSCPCSCPFRRTYFLGCSLTKICLFHHCMQLKWNVTAALRPPVLNCVTVSVRRTFVMERKCRGQRWTVQEKIPSEPDGCLSAAEGGCLGPLLPIRRIRFVSRN